MSVRAKMRVTGVREWLNGGSSKLLEGVEVTMQPVFGDENDKENGQWSKWTPSGELRLNITNPEAFKQFQGQAGKVFYVDITPADS